jgi:hypothetical protein
MIFSTRSFASAGLTLIVAFFAFAIVDMLIPEKD